MFPCHGVGDCENTIMGDDAHDSSEATPDGSARNRAQRRHPELPADIKPLAWAAQELGISKATSYRLAECGRLPGAFKIGEQWRISVPRFMRQVHGEEES